MFALIDDFKQDLQEIVEDVISSNDPLTISYICNLMLNPPPALSSGSIKLRWDVIYSTSDIDTKLEQTREIADSIFSLGVFYQSSLKQEWRNELLVLGKHTYNIAAFYAFRQRESIQGFTFIELHNSFFRAVSGLSNYLHGSRNEAQKSIVLAFPDGSEKLIF